VPARWRPLHRATKKSSTQKIATDSPFILFFLFSTRAAAQAPFSFGDLMV